MPVITLSKENNIKLLEQLKSEFKRTIKFSHYYIPKVQIKDFNALIDGKSFFDLPVKNGEKACEKIIEMSNNNDYITGNLLDFANYKENYRLNAINLSKQTKFKDLQQINFIGKIEGYNNGVTMLFIIERSEETTFDFSQNFVNIL